MDNVPEGLIIVVYRGTEKPKSIFFSAGNGRFFVKFSLEKIFNEPVMRWVLLSIKWGITLKMMAHHSSTLTQLITSSSCEKIYKYFYGQNICFYGQKFVFTAKTAVFRDVSCLGLKGKMMVKFLLAHAHRHLPMHMPPFARNSDNEEPEKRPIWQPR